VRGVLKRLLAIGVAIGAALVASQAATADDEKVVLLVYGEARLVPAILRMDDAIRSTFASRPAGRLRFFTEYLDESWFEAQQPQIRRVLAAKYAGRRIDLVMPCGYPAASATLGDLVALFPGIPVVFCGVEDEVIRGSAPAPNVTGVTMVRDWRATVELALRLHPATRHLVFVSGSGAAERGTEDLARRALARYEDRLNVTFLTGRSMARVVEAVRTLAAGTVVIVGPFLRDATGRTFTGPEAVSIIAGASTAPVYGTADTALGSGIVGGLMLSFEAQGVKAAELGLRILRGELLGPADITTVPSTYMFDARQLRRWRISESRLPPGSLVRFQEPSIWDAYKWRIAGGVAVVGLQSLLIAGLLAGRRQRMHSERRLGERLQFETLLSDLGAGFVKSPADDVDRQIEHALRRIVDVLGVDRASLGELVADNPRLHVMHAWAKEPGTVTSRPVETRELPWITRRLRGGHVVSFSDPAELPDEAANDRRTLLAHGVNAVIFVPVVVGGTGGAVLVCSQVHGTRRWSKDLVERLRLIGEIFAVALIRRQADAAVRESDARFRVIADSAPVMIWMSAPDGRCVYVNRSWLEFTGRTLPQEMGEGWLDGVDPDDRRGCQGAFLDALAARRVFRLEYRLRRHDGGYRHVLDHRLPRFEESGNFTGYIGSATDISEVKSAHQALLETISLRSAIFGSLYGEMVALDRDGVMLAVNESWTRFAQENGGDPVKTGVGANYLDVCQRAALSGHPEAQKALEAIHTVLDGKVPQALVEYTSHSPSRARWFSMTVEPFKRPEGGVIISHIDVTRQRQAEEAVERDREELAHVLRVTTLGELAASMAHEINQPLAAIVSNAQAVRRLLGSRDPDPGGILEAVEDIAADARRAAEVIKRLHALFRKEPSDRRPVDIDDVVSDVTNLLAKDLERKEVSVRLRRARSLPHVVADVVQLEQVVLNLLVNACEAMATAEPGSRQVIVETSCRESGIVHITVGDAGVGVAEPDLDQIFEPFVTTKPNGLGMGLSISRSIIRAHGGRIWATRNKERGLTMHIELPCLPDHR